MTKALATTNQKAVSLKQYLNKPKCKQALSDAAPKWLSPDRMLRIIMGEASKNPKILECTPESILLACIQSAQLGLEPILGRAYIVPYWNGKKKCSEAQLQVGYQGLIDLARRSGAIADVYGAVVYENDEFEEMLGYERTIIHRPWHSIGAKERGEIRGAYAIWVLKDGTKHHEFMHISDIEKRRDKSQAYQYAKKSGFSTVWDDWQEEMVLKTVIKHSSKMVPASIDFMEAVTLDHRQEQEPIDITPEEKPSIRDMLEVPKDELDPTAMERFKALEESCDAALLDAIKEAGVKDVETDEQATKVLEAYEAMK